MGEKDNGYASCDLRRGQRSGKGWYNNDASYRRTRNDDRCDTDNGCGCNNGGVLSGRNDRGSRYNNNDNDCGICRLLGGRNDGRDDHYSRRVTSRSGEQGGCGCSRQRSDGDVGQGRSNGNGCGCGSDRAARGACAKGECHALMNKLQKLDFSIQETVLYLDAYPDCCEALAYYQQLVKERCEVAKEYEENCGPLTSHGNGDASDWNWAAPAWPWHHEFPGNRRV